MIRNYLYIDSNRLDMLAGQIPSAQPKEKKTKKSVAISMQGPRAELSEETSDRALKNNEKIELLIQYLQENELLAGKRPERMNDDQTDGYPFVYESMFARKLILPGDYIKHIPGLKHLAIWVSDPDPDDLVTRDHVWRGTFVYLTEAWLDDGECGTVYSGCSALQAIANVIEGKPLIDLTHAKQELLGRGNSDHPIKKLHRYGAVESDRRLITSLYLKRYMTNEQCFVINGEERRVNDLLGYPIFIAEELINPFPKKQLA